ncbi:MAG: pyridoxamine 5'-phosphate oxidase family protein [Patescibacteria group bacterium]
MSEKELSGIIKDFLNGHRKAVLSTVGDDEHPTTSLMLYAIDDDLNVYFGTRKTFGKYSVIKRHPYVSLTVVEEKLDPLKAIEIRGKVEFIPEDKTAEMLGFFESKNPSKYYVKGAPDFVMFKVTPSFVRFLDASSGELVLEHMPVGAKN